tara:strand:+ start:3242 stop:3526 length:285 start_codon:yes stop_codon:yes gene_type:complete
MLEPKAILEDEHDRAEIFWDNHLIVVVVVVDLFCQSCVLYSYQDRAIELMFINSVIMQAIQKILDEKPPELQGDFSKNLKEFVSLCLRKNVSQR